MNSGKRRVVLDASACFDLVRGRSGADWIASQVADAEVAVPGHMHTELLSTTGRHVRQGHLGAADAEEALVRAAAMPMDVTPVAELLVGAWRRRGHIALRDALYVELADRLGTVVITTDVRLARSTSLAVAPPEVGL